MRPWLSYCDDPRCPWDHYASWEVWLDEQLLDDEQRDVVETMDGPTKTQLYCVCCRLADQPLWWHRLKWRARRAWWRVCDLFVKTPF